MKNLLSIIFVLFVLQIQAQPSIYGFSIPGIETGTINFNNYQGKKILLVNTATTGPAAPQYAELQQLHARFKDSGLVIIAVPSNSFNNEPKTNAEINQFCATNYNISFPQAAKADVKGGNAIDLYKWLTAKTQNTVMDSDVKKDFQKYLINTQGKLVGVFSIKINPMNAVMINAIRSTQ
jgi:glutathione peroxidase